MPHEAPDNSILKVPERAGRKDLVFALVFLCVVIYSVRLVPYGISTADESFYLTIPYRLVQGDCFFVDEWHVSQLSGFLLYPLMQLYLLIFPTTDGIFYVFRCLFVAAKSLTGLYIYIRGRRISQTGAGFACLFFMLYSPFCVRALSYNSMGVMFMALATVTAATVRNHGFIDMVFTGLCLAAAVLCCPYLAALFAVYVIFCIALAIYTKKHGKPELFGSYAFSPAGLVALCVGVSGLFLVFCCFVFSRTGLKEIISSVPYIFMDPEHVDMSWIWFIKNYVLCVIRASSAALPVLVVCTVNTALMFIDKRRMEHRVFYLAAAAVLSFLFTYPFIAPKGSNEFMLAINYLGFTAYCVSERKEHALFQLVFIPGLIYTACLHHASNQRFHAICNASAVCTVASAFFICTVIGELMRGRSRGGLKKYSAILVSLLLLCSLLFQAGIEGYMQTVRFYGDSSLAELTYTIDRGVQKGLITTEEKASEYYAVWDDTQQIRDAEGEYVLYVSGSTWLPLADTKRTACYSGWTLFDKPVPCVERLVTYLQLHPEKAPAYIYVPTEFVYDYQPSVSGKMLLDILNTQSLPVIETATGYLVVASTAR